MTRGPGLTFAFMSLANTVKPSAYLLGRPERALSYVVQFSNSGRLDHNASRQAVASHCTSTLPSLPNIRAKRRSGGTTVLGSVSDVRATLSAAKLSTRPPSTNIVRFTFTRAAGEDDDDPPRTGRNAAGGSGATWAFVALQILAPLTWPDAFVALQMFTWRAKSRRPGGAVLIAMLLNPIRR